MSKGREEPRSAYLGGLGKRFRIARQQLGLSSTKCGVMLGMSYAAVLTFERGETVPRGKRLDAIVSLLDQFEKRIAAQGGPMFTEPGYVPTPPATEPPVGRTITCPSCGEEVPGPPRFVFCGVCGSPLGVACTSCGHLNFEPFAKFCSQCSAKLPEKSEDKPEPPPKKAKGKNPDDDFFK